MGGITKKCICYCNSSITLVDAEANKLSAVNFGQPWQQKLVFILEKKIEECKDNKEEVLKKVDSFMRMFAGALFVTRPLGGGTFPLLSAFESNVWKGIVDNIVNGESTIQQIIPTADVLISHLKESSDRKAYYKEHVQAKKDIIFLKMVSHIVLLRCNGEMCFLIAFPTGVVKNDSDCELCLNLIYNVVCKRCQGGLKNRNEQGSRTIA